MKNALLRIYEKLHAHFGPRNWWPADTPFEVMVGAILTQNAAWSNVEKAIRKIKKARLLSPEKIHSTPIKSLRRLVRPSGFYNEKAKKLKRLTSFLFSSCGGKVNALKSHDTDALRAQLLKINGIGPETADSILLYALEKPVFVVDAYTKRIFSRHGVIKGDATYGEVQNFFMKNIPGKRRLYNEYHALIVELGKSYCKKTKPICNSCPLKKIWYNRKNIT